MKTRTVILVLIVIFSLGYAMHVTAQNEQNELVKGWYDPVNEWFVFEWERPDEGKVTSILDLSNNIEPAIDAKVAYDGDTADYMFDYEITNKRGKQPIFTILIKYDASEVDIHGASVPTEKWSTDENKMEEAWDWAKVGGEINGIPPGETVKGFSFSSNGVPAITNAVFRGYRRAEVDFPGDFDTEEVNDAFDVVYENLKEQYKDEFKDIVLKTIGPTAPPEELVPADFLQGIIDMKHEAMELGWVTNEGIKDSLDVKLEAALKKLQSGNTKAAKNILGAFIKEVEAQGCETYEDCPKGKHLTPEAYALLKFNAQYLIDNLK